MQLHLLAPILLAVSALAATQASSTETLPSALTSISEPPSSFSMSTANLPSSGSTNSSPTLVATTVSASAGYSSIPLVISETTTWASAPPTVYLSAPPKPTTISAGSDTSTVVVNQCMITGRQGSIVCTTVPIVYVSGTATSTLSGTSTVSIKPSTAVSSVVVPNVSGGSVSKSVATLLLTLATTPTSTGDSTSTATSTSQVLEGTTVVVSASSTGTSSRPSASAASSTGERRAASGWMTVMYLYFTFTLAIQILFTLV